MFDREWPLRVGDIDRVGRLRLDAACRHIQDIGQDQLREMGYEETHPLWIVRRTMVDLIRPDRVPGHAAAAPLVFGDLEPLVRDAGPHRRPQGRPDRVRGVLDQHQPRDPGAGPHLRRLHGRSLQRTTDVDRLRWKSYLNAGCREDAAEIRDFPVRVSDIDLFDHVNNSVYWKVVEDYLAPYPELLTMPLRVTIEHDAAGGARRQTGDPRRTSIRPDPPTSSAPALTDRTVRTLTYVVGDEVKALAVDLSDLTVSGLKQYERTDLRKFVTRR